LELSEDSVGQKVEEAGENVRQSRDTIGQKVDEGILEGRKAGTNLSESKEWKYVTMVDNF